MDKEYSFSFCDFIREKRGYNYDIVDCGGSRGSFIKWGEDNKFPQFIWDNYLRCSDLQSLVQTTVDYIIGSDILVTKDSSLLSQEPLEEIVRRCVFDYILFGGFAVSCVRNNGGDKIVRIKYQNVMNIRVNEELSIAYLCGKWGTYTSKGVVELPLYNPCEEQSQFLLYYRGDITRNINPISIWQSALKSVEVLNNTRLYNLRNIQNNFSANVMISLNGTSIKNKELEDIKRKLSDGYEGADNAGKTLLINNANSDGKVEVVRLDSDKASDLYVQVQNSSIEDLYGAFRINKVLVGKNINTGFSRVEYQDIYAIYKSTVIEPLRKNIIKVFKSIGIGIAFEDIKIDWSE